MMYGLVVDVCHYGKKHTVSGAVRYRYDLNMLILYMILCER